jgi:hypothetical protein
MKKKKSDTLPIRNASAKFENCKKQAIGLGFSMVSPEREKRDQKLLGIIPPNSRRLDGLGKAIFEKQKEEYTIRFVSTFDEEKKKFSKNGKIWVRVVAFDQVSERERGVFTWKTTRTGKFLERALLMMEFLDFALEKRPLDGRNKLCKLESRVGINEYHPYVWVGRGISGEKIERFSFINFYPGSGSKSWPKVQNFIEKWAKYVWYYETKRRLAMGYKRRERDIRKPYTTKKMQKNAKKK